MIHGHGILTISKGAWKRDRQGEARKKIDAYRRRYGAAQVEADEGAQIAAAHVIHCRRDPILVNDHLHAKVTRRYWDGKPGRVVEPERTPGERAIGAWADNAQAPRTAEEDERNRAVLQHLPLALAVANARRPGRGWVRVCEKAEDDADLCDDMAAAEIVATGGLARSKGWQSEFSHPDMPELAEGEPDDDTVAEDASFAGPLKIVITRDDAGKGQKDTYYIDLAQQDDYFQVAVEALLRAWKPDTITTTFGSYAKVAASREVYNHALRQRSVVRHPEAATDTSLDAGLDTEDDDSNGLTNLHEILTATEDGVILYAGGGENPTDTAMAAALYAAERNRALAAAVPEHLTAKQQQVVRCASAGLNQEETAQRLGIDQRTVSDTLARATARLRKAPGLKDYQRLADGNTVKSPEIPTVRIGAQRTPPSGVVFVATR